MSELKTILIKGLPLMFNEVLWAAGMTTVTQCYSVRGLDVVAGLNIATTITNLFNIVYIQLGHVSVLLWDSIWEPENWKRQKTQTTR